jgi:hypothetical protein
LFSVPLSDYSLSLAREREFEEIVHDVIPVTSFQTYGPLTSF